MRACIATLLCGLLVHSANGQGIPDAGKAARPEIHVMIQLQDSLHVIGEHTAIPKEELLKAVSVAVRHVYPDADLEVAGFTLSTEKNGNVLEAVSTDEKLTDAQRELISEAVPGSRIYFENLRVRWEARVWSVGTKGIVVE